MGAVILWAPLQASFAQGTSSPHQIVAHLTDEGTTFIENEIPNLIPEVINPPPSTSPVVGCIDATTENMSLYIDQLDLDISYPEADVFKVDLLISVHGDSDLEIDDLYVCFGSASCAIEFDMRNLSATVEYEVNIENGEIRLNQRRLDFTVAENDFDVDFSSCGLVDNLLNAFDDTIEDRVLDTARDLIGTEVPVLLEQFVDDFSGSLNYQLAHENFFIDAGLQNFKIETTGIELEGFADITSSGLAATCVGNNIPAEPGDYPDASPSLVGRPGDVVAAVNLGLVEDLLFHAWREGFLCVSDDTFNSFGVDLDLEHTAMLLPGFPPGTRIDLNVFMATPPRVAPNSNDFGAEFLVSLDDVEIFLVGNRPDGTVNTLEVNLSAEASVAVGLDPRDSALKARVIGVEVKELTMQDIRGAVDDGFDVDRILDLAHKSILPTVLGELGDIPITGPVVQFQDYAVTLEHLDTSEAHVFVGAGLHRTPLDDNNPPDTFFEEFPFGPINPLSSAIRMSGSDGEISSELLSYQVRVDGELMPSTFLKTLQVGELGISKEIEVEVAAVDLAGNVDPSPARETVFVDGVLPVVVVDGSRVRIAASSENEMITWTMADDLTVRENLRAVVEVHRLRDDHDILSTEQLDVVALDPGVSSYNTFFVKEGVYRVAVEVQDEAGNKSRSSVLLEVPSTKGCGVGGSGTGALGFMLMLCLWGVRRKRTRSTV